jgi:hypothetical protein
MKSQGYILHKTMLTMFVLLAASMGHAQYGIRATIPFNFTTEAQSHPPGHLPPAPIPCPKPGRGETSPENCPIPPKL